VSATEFIWLSKIVSRPNGTLKISYFFFRNDSNISKPTLIAENWMISRFVYLPKAYPAKKCGIDHQSTSFLLILVSFASPKY